MALQDLLWLIIVLFGSIAYYATCCDIECSNMAMIPSKWSRDGTDLNITALDCSVRSDCERIDIRTILNMTSSSITELEDADVTFNCFNGSKLGFRNLLVNSSETKMLLFSLRVKDCILSWDDVATLAEQVTLFEVDSLFTSPKYAIQPVRGVHKLSSLSSILQLTFFNAHFTETEPISITDLLPNTTQTRMPNVAILGVRCAQLTVSLSHVPCERGNLLVDPVQLQGAFPSLQSLSLDAITLTDTEKLGFPWSQTSYRLPFQLKYSLFQQRLYKERSAELSDAHFVYRMLTLVHVSRLNITGICDGLVGSLNGISIAKSNLSTSMPHDCFRNISNLTYIDLGNLGNFLKESIPESLFSGLTNLATLYLGRLKIEHLPHNIFAGLTKLKILYLNHNTLERIEKGSLRFLYSLERLYLQGNNLVEVERGSLPIYSNNLIYIDVKRNRLNSVPLDCLALPKLDKCDCDHNNISLGNLQELVEHYDPIRMQQVSPISYYMAPREGEDEGAVHQPSQSIISLRYCNVSEVSFNMSWPRELKIQLAALLSFFEFDLASAQSGYPLNCTCGLYDLKQFIRTEAVELIKPALYPHITPLDPDNFLNWKCHLNKLVTNTYEQHPFLDVSDFSFTCINHTLMCPERCQCWSQPFDGSIIVDCRLANLTEFPANGPIPSGNAELMVNLEWNHIATLPDCDERRYHYLQHARYLDFKWNLLVPSIPEFERFLQTCAKNMTSLYMAYNKIQFLPQTIQQYNFKWFSIYNNNLLCNCLTKWMKPWIIEKKDHILYYDRIQCDEKDVPIILMNEDEDFPCDNDSKYVKYIPVITVFAMLFILTMVVSMTLHIYAFELKILLFEKLNLHPLDRNKDDRTRKSYDAYLMYCDDDYRYATETLLVGLERCGYRIYVPDRDMALGAITAEARANALADSHRVIVVISQKFVNDDRSMCAFLHAFDHDNAPTRQRYLVLIRLRRKINFRHHDVFKKYLSTNFFVAANSKRFWSNLTYWLPLIRHSLPDATSNIREDEIVEELSDDDNFGTRDFSTSDEQEHLPLLTHRQRSV